MRAVTTVATAFTVGARRGEETRCASRKSVPTAQNGTGVAVPARIVAALPERLVREAEDEEARRQLPREHHPVVLEVPAPVRDSHSRIAAAGARSVLEYSRVLSTSVAFSATLHMARRRAGGACAHPSRISSSDSDEVKYDLA